MTRETLFAPASGGGRAAVAVFRLSGPAAGAALMALTGMALPPARQAVLRRLRGVDGEIIDQGLALWFPGPASFTGEDVVELQLHGGRAVATALTETLLQLGLRPAEPGAFTRRAFEAGKLDLTQAEAIADLVAADTAAQRRQALAQLDGALGCLYEDWRQRLLRAAAHLEAAIDFAEDDLPEGLIDRAQGALASLAEAIAAHLADGQRGQRLRDGFRAVLLGAPNVGKSSLLNRLAGREAAIVSEVPGTTRDVIEVALGLGGMPLLLTDTAGLRVTSDGIEREGVRRAEAAAAAADIRLLVLDGAAADRGAAPDAALLAMPCLILVNKSDLVSQDWPTEWQGRPVIMVSAQTGAGIPALLRALTDLVSQGSAAGGQPALTRARHRLALTEALQALRRAAQETLPELVAEDVRAAVRAVGRITGRVDVEDMLDLIFGEFCIGK